MTKQSFMSFKDWQNGEELDLIIVFISEEGEHRVVTIEDRFELKISKLH